MLRGHLPHVLLACLPPQAPFFSPSLSLSPTSLGDKYVFVNKYLLSELLIIRKRAKILSVLLFFRQRQLLMYKLTMINNIY